MSNLTGQAVNIFIGWRYTCIELMKRDNLILKNVLKTFFQISVYAACADDAKNSLQFARLWWYNAKSHIFQWNGSQVRLIDWVEFKYRFTVLSGFQFKKSFFFVEFDQSEKFSTTFFYCTLV
jgi:hypothetical protein